MVRLRLFALSLLVCISLSSNVVHAQVSETDSLALVALYDATGGPGWTFPPAVNKWLNGPVHTWWGVTVTNKRVTWLVLESVGLQGQLPPELANLDQLAGLTLANNNITGSLSNSPILELTNLWSLWINQNQFTGEIPTEIGNLSQLQLLHLGVNGFTGEIPAAIGSLTSLTWLQLGQNQLSGEIPTGLGNLSNLTTLGLHENNLEGDVPADFAGMTSIISINLSQNQLTGLPALPPFPSLSGFSLTDNRFTFEDFELNFDLFAATTAVLTPQADVDAVVDGMGTVSVTVGGANNVYQWYIDNEATPERDGFWIDGANNPSYTPTYAGDYYVRITNSYLNTLPGQYSHIELFSNIVTVVPIPRYLEVNTTADDPDGNVADGICDTGSSTSGLTGLCTLRAAIESANGRGTGEITFDIPSAGIPTIQPTYALPWIVVPVELDGTTQPGGRVEISGNQAGPDVDGLVLAGGSSLLTGLVVNRFSGNGIVLNTNNNSFVENTYVGTTSSGDGRAGNGGHGIWIDDVAINRIGDAVPEKQNIISANGGHGIFISGSNAIGNVIENAVIGSSQDYTLDLGNQGSGIFLEDASTTSIGGREPWQGTLIRFNAGAGVSVVGAGDANKIIGNSIYQNVGLAIDLGADGRTGNDLGNGKPANVDIDDGPNRLVNFPGGVAVSPHPTISDQMVLTAFVEPSIEVSNPVVHFYMSSGVHASGRGEGERGLAEAIPNESGYVVVNVNKSLLVLPNVSAIATYGAGSTSEFSMACMDTDGDKNPDSDGDGLCDNWEKDGIDYDGDGDIDLPLQSAPFSAAPAKKDLFVELDYMLGDGTHCKKPVPAGITDVQNAFARKNISLHAMLDEEVPHIDQIKFAGARDSGPVNDFQDVKVGEPFAPCSVEDVGGHFGTKNDREGDNCPAILGARRLVFRYGIYGHTYQRTPGSSGIAEAWGDDFMVTLGTWDDNDYRLTGASEDPVKGRRTLEAGTLMHEFGHTLGLHHGGDNRDNCKPNYPSIMNYTLQFPQYVSDRVLDYSSYTSALATLDESSLSEPAGVRGPANRKNAYRTTTGTKYWIWSNSTNVDWDGIDKDGNQNRFDDTDVRANINTLSSGCTGAGTILTTYDDWANLKYGFRSSAHFIKMNKRLSAQDYEEELTKEMVIAGAESFDYDDDGYMNADDNCPPYYNPDQLDMDGDGVGDICEMPVADLIVTSSASAEKVMPGEQLTYSISVYNLGPDTTAVSLTDTLDARLSVVSAVTDRGICSAYQNIVRCDFGEMVYDDSLGVTLTVQAASEAEITNTVSVASALFDPDSTNNVATTSTVVAVATEEHDDVPDEFDLGQNYPNPFNPVTTVEYTVPAAGHVQLAVLDLLGRTVLTVVDGYQSRGMRSVQIDASDLTSGIYLYRLTAGNRSVTRRMVVLK